MTDVYLAVMTVAVVVVAAAQVVFAIVAFRAARRAQALVARLEQDVKPLLAQVQSISADVARTSALVATQAERVDGVTGRLALIVDDAAAIVTQNLLVPLRDGLALVRSVVAAVGGAAQERAPGRATDAGPEAAVAPLETSQGRAGSQDSRSAGLTPP